jgi:hypothetical protein
MSLPRFCRGAVGADAGQGEEGIFEPACGDLQVPGRGLGQQPPGDGIGAGVAAVDQDGVAAYFDAVGSRDGPQRGLVGAGPGRPDRAAGGQALDLGGGPVRHDLAVGDQHDPVGVGVGFFQVVGGEDDRPAPGGALHVHALGRLIEDEQLGVGNQGHGEPQPLLFSPRALPDPAARDRGDAGPFQHFGDRAAHREKLGGVLHRLCHREILEQAPRLHDRGDQALSDRLPRRHAVNLDRAGVRAGQAQDHVDRRGLPRPVGPQERHHLPCADGQRDSLDGLHRAEGLADPPQVDGKRQPGTLLAPRQDSRLRVVPGCLHGTARRRGQRQGIVTHPGCLCGATTTGRKSPCETCALRRSRSPRAPLRSR